MKFIVLNGWTEFWQGFADFFWKVDESGINYLTRIGIALAIVVVAWIFIKFVMMGINKAMGVKKGPDIDISAKLFISGLIKVFFWVIIAFVVISVLKLDITGVAGITSAITVALGLSLQDLLSSFFSGIHIIQQKNILTGEYISVKNTYGECEGVVKKIHFFCTYLRTYSGQIVIVPNNNITNSVVTNYTREGKRRVDFDVGVSYDADIELVKKTLMDLFKDDERILPKEVLQVYVAELGSYSVTVRFRCWTKFDKYWEFYNEMPEKVLLAFREKGIRIPSSTDLQVEKR